VTNRSPRQSAPQPGVRCPGRGAVGPRCPGAVVPWGPGAPGLHPGL